MKNRLLIGASDKTDLLLHLIQQDFPHGVTVIDPDGSLARAVLDIIPERFTDDVNYFDPSDAEHVASFNVFKRIKDKAKFVQDICAFFDAMFPGGADTLTRQSSNFVLANVLTIITDTPGVSFVSVLEFLSDTAFRDHCIERCTNPMALRNWKAIEDWDSSQRKAAFAQITAKLGTLLLSPVMYRTLEGSPTFYPTKTNILIANLARAKIGDEAAKLLGTLLISRARTPVYINDFDFFASDHIASLFCQGGYTVALQFLSTVPPNVAQRLLGFDETRVFRTTPEDADRLKFAAGFMEPRPLIELREREFVPELVLEASILVMDSQGMGEGRLLSNIARLKVFGPGQPLEGKLVILQPDMGEHGDKDTVPPALNLFDMGQYNPDLSARDRQILHTSALKMITFALADTTDQQGDMIEYLVQLAMAVPGATIDTVRRMVQAKQDDFFKSYGEALEEVDEVVRDYFTHTYFEKGQVQTATKQAVLRRIMGMLKNPTFRRMFQNERNTFNMQRELEAGKVILINTDVALLGTDACELFGRFFISLLLQATQQRTADKPVFCYIDECQDYIAREENIEILLDKARKQKVGFTFAHQRLSNIKAPGVLDALGNTAIKMAAKNETDASTLAKYMRTTPEFVSNQPDLSFATFIRGTTTQAVSVQIEYGKMEKMDRMSDAEYAAVRKRMRELYCNSNRASSPAQASVEAEGTATEAKHEVAVQEDDDGVVH